MSSDKALGALIALPLLGLAVWLGVLGGSVVVALLLGCGFTLVFVGCGAVEMRRYGWAWLAIATGVAATTNAMWLGDMGGRWLWLPTLLLVGLAVVGAGSSAWPASRRHGEALVALGILVMVLAVLAPLVVYPTLAEPGAATGGAAAAFSAADGLQAVGGTLRAAATSLWGWIDLAVLVLIGVASWRRAGGWLFPLLAVAVVVVGGFSAAAGESIAAAAGTGPTVWLERLLLATDEHWGSAGWGVLVLCAGVVIVSLPILRKLVVMGQVAAAAGRAEGSDNEAVVRFMAVEGYGPGWSSVVVLAFEALYIGMGVALWAGLRRAAAETGALPFDAIRIPDLAVPQFRPVWVISYFALALALGVSAVIGGRIFSRLSVSRRVPVFTSPVWQIGITVIGAFVAPAGVLLFGLGITWMQTAAVLSLTWRARLVHGDVYAAPVSGAPVTHAPDTASAGGGPVWATGTGAGPAASDKGLGQGTPGGGDAGNGVMGGEAGGSGAMGGGFDDRPLWERDGGHERPIWADADGAGGEAGAAGTPPGDASGAAPGSPPPAVSALFDAGPLIDIARLGDDEYVVLGAAGDIALFRDGAQSRGKRLQVVRPLGLGAASARHVAFVDGGGRVLELSFEAADQVPQSGQNPVPVVRSGVIEEADCFAVSPLGTLVVTASIDRRVVSGFFLTSEIGRSLLDGIERPTALGFSLDGRLVAVGTANGDVHVADVGGQGVASVLGGDQAGGRTVVALTGAPGDGWVVAYDDERVALWRGGERLRSVDAGGGVTCLAVHAIDGRVAVGTAFGLVRASDANLETRLAEARPFATEVRRVLWVEGGRAIVCAGAGGEVRRVRST